MKQSNGEAQPEIKGLHIPKPKSASQIRSKKREYLEGLPEWITETLGRLYLGATICVWGDSGEGKSNYLMQIAVELQKLKKCLYVALEEGHQVSFQELLDDYITDDLEGYGLQVLDFNCTYEALMVILSRRSSASVVFIDSIQYYKLRKSKFDALQKRFPRKLFVFISHAEGNKPKGIGEDIKYDATVKIFVKGFMAFIKSRVGGGNTHVIYEKGAKNTWKNNFTLLKKHRGYKLPRLKK